jgi:hypothetical protein
MSTDTTTVLDHFYEIHIQRTKDEVFVYWRSPIDVPIKEVPAAAMMDGHLLASDMRHIDYTLEITAEEYFEHMEE